MPICTLEEPEATREAVLKTWLAMPPEEAERDAKEIQNRLDEQASVWYARAANPNAPSLVEGMATGFKSKAYKDWMLGVGPVPESAKKLGFR